MRSLFLALALLLVLPLRASEFVMDTDLNLSSQAGWGSAVVPATYYQGGSWYHRFPGTDAPGTLQSATVTLGTTYPAATTYVWLRATSSTSTGTASITCGGATSTTVAFVAGIWKQYTIASVSSFSTVVVNFQKITASSSVDDKYFNGIFVTQNANETNVGSVTSLSNTSNLFADYTAPAADPSDYIAGNLIPNSSFELGFGYGWNYSSAAGSPGQATWLQDALDTTDAQEGSAQMKISVAKANYLLYAPVVRVRNDRVKRLYTLSYYAKSNANGTLTITVAHTVPGGSESLSTTKVTTGSWARYSHTVSLSSVPSPEIAITFQYFASGANYIALDCVQFEEGPLSAYAPMNQVEGALYTDNQCNVFSAGFSPVVKMKFHNNSISTTVNRTLNTEVYDWNGNRLDARSQSVSCAPGDSSISLAFTSFLNGSNRVVAWMTENPTIRDELVITLAPAVVGALEPNSFIAMHNHSDSGMANFERQCGFSWNRTLSPSSLFRWDSGVLAYAIEHVEGTFNWVQADYSINQLDGNQYILASLSDKGSSLPAYGQSGGTLITAKWQTYITAVVNRYKDRIHYWEDMNEALNNNAYTPTQYSAILEAAANAVKTEDPTAFFVAFGGAGPSDLANAQATWALLTPTAQGNIDAIAVHFYPDPSRSYSAANTLSTTWSTWTSWASSIGKPIWNTESGTYGMGVKKSDVIGWISAGKYPRDFWATETFRRATTSVEFVTMNALRSAGWGWSKYFYQDSRVTSTADYRGDNTSNYILDQDNSMRPIGASLMWAQSFLRGMTAIGKITNAGSANSEAYLFSGSGKTMIALWNIDLVNRLLSTSQTDFTVYDTSGNVIAKPTTSSMVIKRIPQYIYSTGLSQSQMSALFTAGTITSRADADAPQLSIDASPHGAINARSFPITFRWTAIDDTDIETDSTPLSVLTRWRIPTINATWSAWTGARTTTMSSASGGTYALEVQAKDSTGNTTSTVTGPSFQIAIPTSGMSGAAKLKGHAAIK